MRQEGAARGVVICAAFSPDGQQIASGSGKDSAFAPWDARPVRKSGRSFGHTIGLSVLAVAFSPDRRQIASGGDDKTVKLWDVTTGANLHVKRTHQTSPDRSLQSRRSANRQWKQRWFDQAMGCPNGPRNDDASFPSRKRCNRRLYANGKRIIAGMGGGVIKVWDAGSGANS